MLFVLIMTSINQLNKPNSQPKVYLHVKCIKNDYYYFPIYFQKLDITLIKGVTRQHLPKISSD
jgi:hypothetical protein